MVALPHGIDRSYVATPGGTLELLSALPSKARSKITLFFVHGGFGSAAVWLDYLAFFSNAGFPCHAISLRGHGASYYPGFWRMTYGTSRRNLADDLVAGFKHVAILEKQVGRSRNICLIGHSSGGGLAQFGLNQGHIQVAALVLLGSVPGFGSLGVYRNWWFRVDPFSLPRILLHFYHPASPLSTLALIRNVFFTPAKPEKEIVKFRQNMPGYESLMWAMSMMCRFVEPARVLDSICGAGERLLVLSGSDDKICTPDIMREMAAWYGAAAEPEKRVTFELEDGAPHHIQNDVQWKSSAQKILRFCHALE